MGTFNGLGMNLGNLSWLSNAKTRSISAENPSGEKGAGAQAEPAEGSPARELGKGWKCRPAIFIKPGETATLAEIAGPGAIQSIWFAGHVCRDLILRVFWDEQQQPSVECPLNDFFAIPWSMQDPKRTTGGPALQISSLLVAVNPNRGLNCFWEMPFQRSCRITLTNQHPVDTLRSFYQINYTLTEVPQQAAYFHAQFRRTNPLPYMQPYTILDGVEGKGQYVGTSMGWGANSKGWWGEGEIKFYLDGDQDYPTICGTGLEDYFGGAFGWEIEGQYVDYTTPFVGMHQVRKPGSQPRYAMYRWHVMDPIRFEQDLHVTIQALGWQSEGRFLPLQDDICSVAYWYQTLPTAPFPTLPQRNQLEII
jgi:hypothetical protein